MITVHTISHPHWRQVRKSLCTMCGRNFGTLNVRSIFDLILFSFVFFCCFSYSQSVYWFAAVEMSAVHWLSLRTYVTSTVNIARVLTASVVFPSSTIKFVLTTLFFCVVCFSYSISFNVLRDFLVCYSDFSINLYCNLHHHRSRYVSRPTDITRPKRHVTVWRNLKQPTDDITKRVN